jgi:hypothetical protein
MSPTLLMKSKHLSHIYIELNYRCVICAEEMKQEEGENFTTIGFCSHEFHEKCIKKWFKNNKKCPICMRDVEEFYQK